MFVIPCKYNKHQNYVFECVDRIKKFHPQDKILVVDSCSDDPGYTRYLGWGVEVIYGNKNYGTNAFAKAYSLYPEEDFYYCIYDSLMLNAPLKEYEQFPLTAFRYFKTPPTGWGWDENDVPLSEWAQKYFREPLPEEFYGIMGPMFMAQNYVMECFSILGLFDIKPEDKYQLCAMERIYGIVAGSMGLDFWTHAPQGEMGDFFGEYPEDKVTKINAARM